MIGQTIINNTYGGRGRLSTLLAGTFMLFSVIILNKFVTQIPVVALASVMVVVAISTFNWSSIKRISKVPKSDTLVMISTVIVVLLTQNLAYGVVVGIMISAIAFVSKISHINIKKYEENGNITYKVNGQLFFVSTTKFIDSFNYNDKANVIDIDFDSCKVWDESAVDAIDKVIIKYNKNNIKINLIGLSKESLKLIDNMSTYNKLDNLDMGAD